MFSILALCFNLNESYTDTHIHSLISNTLVNLSYAGTYRSKYLSLYMCHIYADTYFPIFCHLLLAAPLRNLIETRPASLASELYSFKTTEKFSLCSELSIRHLMNIVSNEETLALRCCFLFAAHQLWDPGS